VSAPGRFTAQMRYCTGGCAHLGSLIVLTRSATIRPSVTYAKPASAEPSATFDVMPVTFGSWLTVLLARMEPRRMRASSLRV
jgi:hypothetical protein